MNAFANEAFFAQPQQSLNERMHAAIAILANPTAYIESLLWIKDKRGDVIPFKLNDIQRKILARKRQAVESGRRRRFLILKARRMGVTTLEQALNFHCVATRPNQQVLTIAHLAESTEKIFRIVNLFYERMNRELRPQRLTSHNKRDLNLAAINSLYYIGTAGSKGIGRSDTLNRVHWSEVAWTNGSIEDQNNILAGLTEACSEGEVVLETTANGVGDLFNSLWTEAASGQGEWTAIFLPWWEDSSYRLDLDESQAREIHATLDDEEKMLVQVHHLDVYQIAWRRKKMSELKSTFKQEYPEDAMTCFLISGSRFFDPMIIEAIVKRGFPCIEQRDGGQITIWKKPERGRRYCAGADVAEGVPTGDFSVLGIIDAETEEQVATMRGRWKPEDFAARSAKLCVEYNTALLAPERNNHGHSMLNTLMNVIHYPNIYHHMDYDQKSGKHTPSPGFPTDSKTRPIMLDELRSGVEDGHMIVHDGVFCGECSTFVANRNGKYEAREGCHDDTVIAWAIARQAKKRLGDIAVFSPNTGTAGAPKRIFQPAARRFF